MENLNICLVSDTVYDVNGVSRFIQDFSKVALKENRNFNVITSTKKKHYESISNIHNIKPFFRIKMPFYASLDLVFPSFFKIKRKIKELKPDLLHISTPGTVGLCALIVAKIYKIPIVGIYHTDFPAYMYKNTESSFVKWGTIQFLKIFYTPYKALFSRSKDYFQVIQKQLNFKEEDLYLLKAGIDIQNFDKSYKDSSIWSKYGVDENSFKVLYVGRISVEKNVHIMIEHWKNSSLKNCELLLVGDLELKNTTKEELEKYNIKLIGRKQEKELAKLYASSDCFFFPSTTDTLGQVVMEAMSSALPVIVTNKGGPKTFVNESYGYIVDINNSDEVSKAIKELSLKDEKYHEKKKKAYEFMRDKSISHSFLEFWENNKAIYGKVKKV